MSNYPEDFSPETRILDKRPGGASGPARREVPPGFHGGDRRGASVPPPDNPTVIFRGNNDPTTPLTDRDTRPMPGVGGAREAQGGTKIFPGAAGAAPEMADPVVGWLVVVGGAGRGSAIKLGMGRNSIGRGSKERVRIDFGDEAISREQHAFVTYEPRGRSFSIVPGTGSGLTYLNGEDIVGRSPLKAGDLLEMGSTVLRFVPLCGQDFDWHDGPLAAPGTPAPQTTTVPPATE